MYAYISACRQDRIEMPKATTQFFRMPNSMALRSMFFDVSGSRKSNMAVVKPKIHVSRLVDMLELEVQRQVPCFR